MAWKCHGHKNQYACMSTLVQITYCKEQTNKRTHTYTHAKQRPQLVFHKENAFVRVYIIAQYTLQLRMSTSTFCIRTTFF